ncbi:MAG TPA: metallophosphoesterase, partial [Flavitalea sp.]|nr:metallophosphoesterase [Flavitalea sp.]
NRFDILFNNRRSQSIDSVVLKGTYWNVRLESDSVHSGRFEYDSLTRMYVNTIIRAGVPTDAPEELYDLVVYCGGESFVSKRSVKVVKSFPARHKFIHITDTHVSRNWIGEAGNGYAKELELLDKFIDVANIIAPDFVVVTGDLTHDYTRFNADSREWGGTLIKKYDQLPTEEEKFKNYYEGAKGFRGVQGIDAPVFSVPGNHDFYGMKENDYLNKCMQWNSISGKRVYAVSFAGTRLLGADDFLGDPVNDKLSRAPMSVRQRQVFDGFLKDAGSGQLRIMAKHSHRHFDTAFLNKNNIQLVLTGHSHTPGIDTLGTTPSISMRPGVVCRSGELEGWEKRLGFFRIFYVDGGNFQYTAPLRFCSNPTAAYKNLDLNLLLSFSNNNTGISVSNTATLTNKFPVDLPGCRVRFVMKKGKYRIDNGVIRQVVNTDKFTVIDVNVDLKAGDLKRIKIETDK